ncbi:hypothetical protein ACTI_53260 [Actinoplanes sp. OR16]|uniref:hypothetical protein n=1 Tax=Actinoplanes sp. OR16 TaxID=946334 RepID=UPI000F6C3459|nr:hypothetical protein [Actinoplanes sp. OR16]BBH68641.1 hypothetical protein ACTI_53260 [Actinoplanes sp. OR16]
MVAAAVVALLAGIRVTRSRHRRFLHPAGRSFTGELEIWGAPARTGSVLLDNPSHWPVTIRLSKGIGTRGSRPDVLGVAIRLHGHGTDLLLSTAGTGPMTRHLPAPRRSFASHYGSITAYRTGDDRKIYLSAGPSRTGTPLGRSLGTVTAAALTGNAQLVLCADEQPFGRVTFGELIPGTADAALAFDPIRNATPDLRPTGAIHGTRALAYRVSQRWRRR